MGLQDLSYSPGSFAVPVTPWSCQFPSGLLLGDSVCTSWTWQTDQFGALFPVPVSLGFSTTLVVTPVSLLVTSGFSCSIAGGRVLCAPVPTLGKVVQPAPWGLVRLTWGKESRVAPYHGWWWSRFYGERRAGTHCWLLGPGNREARWGCLSTTPPRLVVLPVIHISSLPGRD